MSAKPIEISVMILVLTSCNDRTADRVVAELGRRGEAVDRFDVADFPCRVTINAELHGRFGWRGWVKTEDGQVPLDQVKSIYYRRPTSFIFPDDVVGSDLAFAAAEARRGFGGLLFSLPARWVNHPASVADAEFKPAQLHVAVSCGLTTPRTLLTSDPNQARIFCEAVEQGIVYKPLSAANIVTDDEVQLVFTSKVFATDFDDIDLSLTMNLLQEWVPKRYDARVTVIGQRLFGVAIRAASPDAYVDWRADYASLRYEPIDVPVCVSNGISSYMNRFDLLYGAFDFAVTDDHWYFLECNANGQFGWLEAETGLPITAAIADLLAGVAA
ncbi:MAG: ATP-grasp ribosomal peptide maturase [Pseudonocardiaceae bacterium]